MKWCQILRQNIAKKKGLLQKKGLNADIFFRVLTKRGKNLLSANVWKTMVTIDWRPPKGRFQPKKNPLRARVNGYHCNLFFCARVYTLTYIVHARRKQIAYKICRLFYRQTRHFAKVYVCIKIHNTQRAVRVEYKIMVLIFIDGNVK